MAVQIVVIIQLEQSACALSSEQSTKPRLSELSRRPQRLFSWGMLMALVWQQGTLLGCQIPQDYMGALSLSLHGPRPRWWGNSVLSRNTRGVCAIDMFWCICQAHVLCHIGNGKTCMGKLLSEWDRLRWSTGDLSISDVLSCIEYMQYGKCITGSMSGCTLNLERAPSWKISIWTLGVKRFWRSCACSLNSVMFWMQLIDIIVSQHEDVNQHKSRTWLDRSIGILSGELYGAVHSGGLAMWT